ncbi:hypothetical protein KPL78_06095 [Roseomonas sp. HJA6]|uniref:HTH luxR-type domain-containing protein n=1 Tax=Roseomonas alba TaxID=2846776 RepID=A0ABS7A546_9PROT|nr:hypothetical protein [Neoroseomonas alba]MBW6397413.1 hypothetical protein [Neoroseomonas alba]
MDTGDDPRARLDLSEIIERLYSAAMGQDDWSQVWAAAAGAFGGHSGSLFLKGEGGIAPVAFPGFSPTALRLYEDHFHRIDPWLQIALANQPAPGTMRSYIAHEFLPASAFEASEVWYDFSRFHIGAFHLVGGCIDLGERKQAMIGLHRPRDAAAFEQADERRLRRLLPHLRNALVLARRLGEAEGRVGLGFVALDRLACAVAILDRSRRIVFANAAMERLAAEGCVQLRADAGGMLPGRRAQFSLHDPAEQAQLLRLVENAATLGTGGALRVDGLAEQRRLALLVMPLPRRMAGHLTFSGTFESGHALVFLRDHAQPTALPGEAVMALYGLTAAEVGVARGLLGGRAPEAVARERGVSLATIRTQIRHILEKTGAAGLRELEAMITAP